MSPLSGPPSPLSSPLFLGQSDCYEESTGTWNGSRASTGLTGGTYFHGQILSPLGEPGTYRESPLESLWLHFGIAGSLHQKAFQCVRSDSLTEPCGRRVHTGACKYTDMSPVYYHHCVDMYTARIRGTCPSFLSAACSACLRERVPRLRGMWCEY
ncbi:hypothetical protein OH77DRAFT_203074 [Trametes cingulata]|nr:hypothetical protein OH77DRAFT_203074 [Trametes cingulata]